ncbi:hypothetical protein Lal_00043019 [Lupinus albus]|nr:hypothetical protein Lal_00043019 [Lupinus albus]
MVAASQQVNENLHNLNQNSAPSPSSHPLVPPGPAEYRGLDEFYRRNPSQFHGGFPPYAAIEWIHGVERIFRSMNYSEAQKLAYSTYMLVTDSSHNVIKLTTTSSSNKHNQVNKHKSFLSELPSQNLSFTYNGIIIN